MLYELELCERLNVLLNLPFVYLKRTDVIRLCAHCDWTAIPQQPVEATAVVVVVVVSNTLPLTLTCLPVSPPQLLLLHFLNTVSLYSQ